MFSWLEWVGLTQTMLGVAIDGSLNGKLIDTAYQMWVDDVDPDVAAVRLKELQA